VSVAFSFALPASNEATTAPERRGSSATVFGCW